MARLTREASQERTREQLLEAARVAVARTGYNGTSIADIAEAAGFSKGAFFSNFESKDALLLELLRRHKQQNIASLGQIREEAARGKDVSSALDRYLAALGADADWVKLDIELRLSAARNPAFAADYEALQHRINGALGELIGLLFSKAGRKPPMGLNDLADLFVALIHGLVLQQVCDPGAAIKLVFESLLATSEPQAA